METWITWIIHWKTVTLVLFDVGGRLHDVYNHIIEEHAAFVAASFSFLCTHTTVGGLRSIAEMNAWRRQRQLCTMRVIAVWTTTAESN